TGEDVRGDEPRTQHRHAGQVPALLQLQVHSLGECHHSELAHRVRNVAAGEQSSQRGGVDDVPSDTLVDQDRQKTSPAVDHPPQVHAEDPVPVIQRAAPARYRLGADTGVVADDVDGAVVAQRL